MTSGTLRRADQPEPWSGSYYRFVVLEPNVAPAFSTGPVHTALDIAVRGVAGLLSVDEVLQVIVDQVRPVVGARYAALGIVDPVGHIEKFITSGIDQATRERIGPLPEGRGLLGLIIRENRSFRIADIAADPHSSGFPPNHPPMTSFLGVPITVKGMSLGRLYLTDKIGAPGFSAEDQALVETFAVHAGIAMENARLHEQLNRLAIVDERDRISKDLHDGIIQNLYGVSLSLEDIPELMTDDPQEAADRLERAIDAIHFAIQDIRNFIFGLRPELLAGRSLVGGLASLVEEYRHNTIIDLELRVPDEFVQPPDEVTGQLLAIAGESLSNVVRHSKASRASVELIADGPAGWTLAIEDNGVGMDAAAVVRFGHQGLANMRERAGRIGATISIEGEPGVGTRIEVVVPRSPEEERR